MDPFRQAIGRVLRDVRRANGLTLHEAATRTPGRFKPSSIGSYERGERTLSVSRFCQLAEAYGVPADLLLRLVLDRMASGDRGETVIDLNRIAMLHEAGRPGAGR